jgi:TolA-binding protein
VKQPIVIGSIGGLCLLLMWLPQSARAQLDRIYPLKGGQATGTIVSAGANEVVLRVGGSDQSFAVDGIRKIVFDADPGPLSRGRDLVIDDQWVNGLEELKRVDPDSIKSELVRAELMFYRALAEARLALAGKGDRASAARSMVDFLQKNKDNWHFYAANEVLGDLALSLSNYERAVQYYGALANAPFPEFKLRAAYLEGMALLRQEQWDKARQKLGEVAGVTGDTPASARLKRLAQASIAVAQAATGEAAAGLAALEQLLASGDVADTQLFARLYNAQGDCLRAQDDIEGAVLAYLHTHLLYANDPETHAEALFRLSELWPKLQRQERAAEMRAQLEKLYPGNRFQS